MELTPIWRTPTQAEAAAILRTCRAFTDGLVGGLTAEERQAVGPLGGGTWSVKDLLGHLATHEHRALLVLGVRAPAGEEDEVAITAIADFNARHLERKRAWSLAEVEADYAATRDELVAAIEATDDGRWREKIPTGRGRSALGLVLGKMLNGDKWGLYAHDLAHRKGLERAGEALRG